MEITIKAEAREIVDIAKGLQCRLDAEALANGFNLQIQDTVQESVSPLPE